MKLFLKLSFDQNLIMINYKSNNNFNIVGTQDDHTIISVDIPTLEHVNIRKDTLLPVEKVAGQELLLLTKGYNGTL
jgi:hypothetical protein